MGQGCAGWTGTALADSAVRFRSTAGPVPPVPPKASNGADGLHMFPVAGLDGTPVEAGASSASCVPCTVWLVGALVRQPCLTTPRRWSYLTPEPVGTANGHVPPTPVPGTLDLHPVPTPFAAAASAAEWSQPWLPSQPAAAHSEAGASAVAAHQRSGTQRKPWQRDVGWLGTA